MSRNVETKVGPAPVTKELEADLAATVEALPGLRKDVATKAAAAAALETRARASNDELLLVAADEAQIRRDAAAAPIAADGLPASATLRRRLLALPTRFERARDAASLDANALAKARSELNDAQRRVEVLERQRCRLEEEIAIERARSPEERERRRIRALVDAERAGR